LVWGVCEWPTEANEKTQTANTNRCLIPMISCATPPYMHGSQSDPDDLDEVAS
jgi:hypothetical protein